MARGRRRADAPDLTVENVEAALREGHGIILYAANLLKTSRQRLYRFIAEHPELEEVRREAEVELVDVAEQHLRRNLVRGDMKTIRWYLDRKGKDRGYTTRVEQTGADGGPLEFERIERVMVEPGEEEDEQSTSTGTETVGGDE